MPNQPLDPSIMALTKAIGKQENGGTPQSYDFSKVGVDGERGAYQMTPGWIASNAPTYLKGQTYDPKNLTAAQQDELAYKVVEARGKAGLTPAQIASEWNSGNKDAYKQNHVGTSPGGAAYDTPGYVNNVSKYYEQYKGQQDTSGYNPNPYSKPTNGNPAPDNSVANLPDNQPQPDKGFVQNESDSLTNRIGQGGQAISDTVSGKINPISGLLQTAGAAAGGITDLAGNAISAITPDFIKKPIMQGIQGLVGAAANTGVGKSAIKGVQDFSTAHPELAGDIGAVGNIAGAVGLVTGAGELKSAVGGAVSRTLGRDAASVAEKQFGEVASRTITGRKLVQDNPGALKILSQPEFKPATVTDAAGVSKYATADSSKALDDAISNIDENKLQPLLDQNNTAAVSQKLPLATYRDAAVQEAKDALIDESGVNKLFDRIQAKYGDYPSLSQMNEAKRLVAKQISDAAFGSDTYTAAKTVRASLQKGIEDGANTLGLGDVNALNQEMAQMIRAQKLLKSIDGKSVKLSKFDLLKKGLKQGAIRGAGQAIGAGGLYEGYKKITGQ